MPHDQNGIELVKGDVVSVKFEVVDVFPTEDACNVRLRTVTKLCGIKAPYHTELSAINSKQCEKLETPSTETIQIQET